MPNHHEAAGSNPAESTRIISHCWKRRQNRFWQLAPQTFGLGGRSFGPNVARLRGRNPESSADFLFKVDAMVVLTIASLKRECFREAVVGRERNAFGKTLWVLPAANFEFAVIGISSRGVVKLHTIQWMVGLGYRRRAWQAAISPGEEHASDEPGIPEWPRERRKPSELKYLSRRRKRNQ